MNNHIILEPAGKIREVARAALSGNWVMVTVAVFIYFLLTSVISSVLGYFFSMSQEVEVMGQTVVQSIDYGSGIYDLLVGGPLEFGLVMYLLVFFRKRQMDNKLLFEGFSMFGKTFWLMLYMSLRIVAWGLLLIVPGVIAAIRYSQSFYILVDNPTWTAGQCIEESKRLMMGNKGRYFYLQLTFIGWLILANIPLGFLDRSSATGITYIIFMIVLSVPTLFVSSYMNVANTVFYELSRDNLVIVENSESEDPYRDPFGEKHTDENSDDSEN